MVVSYRYLKTVSLPDGWLFAYLVFLLLQRLFYPVDPEYLLQIGCFMTVYLLFRLIPFRFTVCLLYLLPVFIIFQIIYSYNRLAHPWQGFSDITGIFDNTGIFGGFVAIGFVTVCGLMFFNKPVNRIIVGVLCIPLLVQLIYSQSRAAWIAAIAGISVLLFPIFSKLPKQHKIILISILLLAGSLFFAKIYYFKKDSADGRLLIWTVCCDMIKSKPLTGFGPNGFRQNYLLWQGNYLKDHPDSSLADLADDTTSSFNEFLKVGVEQGIVGLLFVFGIIFLTFTNITLPVVRAVLTTLLVFACFSYPFEFFAFRLLGIIVVAGSVRYPLKSVKPVFICLIVITGGITLFYSRNYYANVKKWKYTIHTLSSKNEKKITELQPLYPSLKRNAWFMFDYGSVLYFAGNYCEAIPVLEKTIKLFPSAQVLIRLGDSYARSGKYAEALQAYETASHIKPSSFTPLSNKAKLYFKLQDYGRAKQEATAILNKKVKIDTPQIKRIKQEMKDITEFINKYYCQKIGLNPIYFEGVYLEDIEEFTNMHFTSKTFPTIKAAIDAGAVIMTDIPSSTSNNSHNVVIVGYRPGGILIYMDPETGCMQTRSEPSFTANYAICITGVK